jgi:hypothetical protein
MIPGNIVRVMNDNDTGSESMSSVLSMGSESIKSLCLSSSICMVTTAGMLPVLWSIMGRHCRCPKSSFLKRRRFSPLAFLVVGLIIAIWGRFPSPWRSIVTPFPLAWLGPLPMLQIQHYIFALPGIAVGLKVVSDILNSACNTERPYRGP